MSPTLRGIFIFLFLPWFSLADPAHRLSFTNSSSYDESGLIQPVSGENIRMLENVQVSETNTYTFSGAVTGVTCLTDVSGCQSKEFIVKPASDFTAGAITTVESWTVKFPDAPNINSGGKWTGCNPQHVVVGVECFSDQGDNPCAQMKLGCHQLANVAVDDNDYTVVSIENFDSNPCPEGKVVTGMKCTAVSCHAIDLKCQAYVINNPNGANPDDNGGDGGGDPHFNTFNDNHFSYHGECDLLLIRSALLGLDIHIRTTRVDNYRSRYSYISGAAVRIGTDVLEVQPDGQLLINGSNRVPELFAGHELVSSRAGKSNHVIRHDLDLANGRSIQIRWNGNTKMMFVDFKGEVLDTSGLLGSKDMVGMLTRDGKTNLDGEWNSYGEEWQVNDSDPKLFRENRAPQFPHGCVYDQVSKSTGLRRRLMSSSIENVSYEVASSVCVSSNEKKRQFCIADVLATGDLELADDPFYN